MSDMRPVVRLKQAQFSERDVDEVVRRAGGKRISEVIFPIPNGILNCDYLIDSHLLELKMIEIEPLERTERQEKLMHIFGGPDLTEKHDTEASGEIHLTGEAHKSYWTLLGAAVRRPMRKAAAQIKQTRNLLKQPNLRGAVFLINCGADSIDPNSFRKLVSRYREDFSSEINAVMCFSAIPSVAQDLNKPCVVFDHEHSGDEIDKAFVEKFKAFFYSVFSEKLGKKPHEILSNDAIVKPLRAPFEINTPKGKIAIN